MVLVDIEYHFGLNTLAHFASLLPRATLRNCSYFNAVPLRSADSAGKCCFSPQLEKMALGRWELLIFWTLAEGSGRRCHVLESTAVTQTTTSSHQKPLNTFIKKIIHCPILSLIQRKFTFIQGSY